MRGLVSDLHCERKLSGSIMALFQSGVKLIKAPYLLFRFRPNIMFRGKNAGMFVRLLEDGRIRYY
jgi:hypothetical protein